MKEDDTFTANFQPSNQEKFQIYGVFRQDFAEILAEKEDTGEVWTGKYSIDFVQKLNDKFEMQYSVKTLLSKLGKALGSGCIDVIIDWLDPTELKTVFEQSGKPTNESINDNRRVLVMIDTCGDKKINIPFQLIYGQYPSPESLLRLVRKFKTSTLQANKKQIEENTFLTGAGVSQKNLRKLQNDDSDKLRDENDNLKLEIYKLKSSLKNNGNEEFSRTTSGAGEKKYNQNEIKSLKKALNDMEIECSIIPTLKKQLQQKNKEIEIFNMYIREVEICSKIRSPIPDFKSYRSSINSGPNTESEEYQTTAGRIVPYNANKRLPGHEGLPSATSQNGRAAARNKTSHFPHRDQTNIYSSGVGGIYNGRSASRSTSKGNSGNYGKNLTSAPRIHSNISNLKQTGYHIDYKLKPKTTQKGSRSNSRNKYY